jgi:hypothetical protein
MLDRYLGSTGCCRCASPAPAKAGIEGRQHTVRTKTLGSANNPVAPCALIELFSDSAADCRGALPVDLLLWAI